MATDFEKNAINTSGGILPGTTDTPGDVRTRVATEADIMNIPNPYIGMLVYVIDTGKRFEITKLKDKKVGFSTVKDALVDTYIEFDPSKDKGYVKEADVDAALDLKADKTDLEGLASEEFVEGKVDEVVGDAPEEFDTLAELAAELAKKVNAEEGKALMDVAEMERLAGVDNYDDAAVKERLDALEAIDHEALVEGLASEQFVQEKIDAIPEYDDSEVISRIEELEAIDHEAFVGAIVEAKAEIEVELAKKAVAEEVEAALELKADKVDLEGLATEDFVAEKVSELVNGAPETLDTLKEIADAFEAHEDVFDAYINQVNAALDLKADKEAVDAKFVEVEAKHAEDVAALDEAKADKVEVEAMFARHQRYELSGLPEGTIVDYRDKEIRVMCPADAEFVKQQVGEGGDANAYYATLTIFAPEGAVYIREGEQGVLEDEYRELKNGRRVKWLSLARFDGANWNYYGKNSSVDKYIGWTHVVEFYDADKKVIAADSIRINLSNEECHNAVAPYYGFRMADKKYVDERIAAIPQFDDSELDGRISALEAIDHVQPNFQYAINMIGEAEPASFTVTGEFPNLVITLNLPQCFSYVDPNAGKMWLGWIPYDETGVVGFNEEDDINEYMTMKTIQQGIDNGSVVEMEPQVVNRRSIGSVNTEAGFVCAIFPESLGYVAYLDNGLGGKVKFDDIDSEDGSTGYMHCQNGTKLVNKIDGVAYCLYGAYVFSPGERFIYIEEA